MHSVSEFLKDLARQLIFDFERASSTGHPVEKGTIGEFSSKKKLASCLPSFVKISSGYVIDSYGNMSRQTDLIVHESSCPNFSLGPEDEYRYFPCEGVCAAGEVKTTLGEKELENCYEKIKSIKSLKRRPLRNSFRKYGSSQPVTAEYTNCLDINNPFYQIFGFVLCKSLSIDTNTLMKHINELDISYSNMNVPTVFISLDDGVFIRAKQSQNIINISYDTKNAELFTFTKFGIDNFPFLIRLLTTHIQDGTTTCESPINPYLSKFDNFDASIIIPRA